MRFLTFSMTAVLALAVSARADLTISSDVHTSAAGRSQTVHLTTMIKGDKVRTETKMDPPPGVPPEMLARFPGMSTVIITDRATGKRVMLLPANKMMKHLPDATTQPAAAPGANQPPAFTATGKTDTINGNAVAEYSAPADQNHSISIWTCTSYPNADQIRPQMQDWLATAQRQQFPALDQVPGIPLKIEVHTMAAPMGGMSPMAVDMTLTVTSISTDAVSDDEFVIPTDYQEMPEGGMGGMGGPPGAGGPAPQPGAGGQ